VAEDSKHPHGERVLLGGLLPRVPGGRSRGAVHGSPPYHAWPRLFLQIFTKKSIFLLKQVFSSRRKFYTMEME